jgi:hypothetical protein
VIGRAVTKQRRSPRRGGDSLRFPLTVEPALMKSAREVDSHLRRGITLMAQGRPFVFGSPYRRAV